MSMKLRAALNDNYRAKREQAYMSRNDVITLQKVPCEMTFRATAAWMSHESEKHHYLPVFHLTGQIEEIHGNFPYNVSSLNFAGEDVQRGLQRDILYYPSPKELAHLIETGKFYTDRFELPEILTANTYSFPALVDLTIVPPPHPAAYEKASYGNTVGADEIDRNNLPIFYVTLAGTGIDRKKDALLDYYGIDVDMDYPAYVLTAESSGYTAPTLMEYVVEPPMLDVGPTVDNTLYMSAEEEAELRRQREQAQQVKEQTPTADYEMTAEDIELAQAQRNIEERVASRVSTLKFERVKEVQAQAEAQRQAQTQTQAQEQKSQSKTMEPVAQREQQTQRTTTLEQLASFMKQPAAAKNVPTEKPTVDKSVETVDKAPVVEQMDVKEEPVAPVATDKTFEEVMEQQVQEEKIEPVAETTVSAQTDAEQKANHPEDPESYKHIEVVVKNASDAMLRHDNDHKNEEQDLAGLSEDEDDQNKLEDAKGADVSDARLQTKVDEAKLRENARQSAVQQQQEMHSEEPTTQEEKKQRGTDAELEAIAEKAAQQHSGLELGE